MPLQVEFTIPDAVYQAAESEAAWAEVQTYSTAKLLMYLKRWVKSTGWVVQIKKLEEGVAGEHFVSEGEVNINSSTTWADTPAVLIHEVLHGLFWQLDEEKILILERKILKEASSKQICTFVHTVFTSAKWRFCGPYSKRV